MNRRSTRTCTLKHLDSTVPVLKTEEGPGHMVTSAFAH